MGRHLVFSRSLKLLLAAALLLAVGAGWAVARSRVAKKQKSAVARIRDSTFGGVVLYDYQMDSSGHEIPNAEAPGPRFLRNWLGMDFFSHAVYAATCSEHLKDVTDLPDLIYVRLCTVGLKEDSDLDCLRKLKNVRSIDLSYGGFTDSALAFLRDFNQIRQLDLSHSEWIGDGGMQFIEPLADLRELRLGETRITNKGLAHLTRCAHLRKLNLEGDAITDEGIGSIRLLSELEELDLSCTEVTDAGFVQIGSLRNLRVLATSCNVSDSALKHIGRLSRLQTLDLSYTKITDAGLAAR